MNTAYLFDLYMKGNFSHGCILRFPWVSFIYRLDCCFPW